MEEKVKSIVKLKKTDYEKGASLALENAENLLEIAKICHEKNFNGNGTSILITAIEELAKAAYLQIKSHNNEIVIKELDRLFKDHKTKHKVFIHLLINSYISHNNKLSEEQQKLMGIGVLIAIVAVLYFTSNSNQTLNIKLEEARQEGYYVNFIGVEPYWKAPKDFMTSKNLLSYISIVEKIFSNVKKDLFNGKLTDENTKKYVENLCDENTYFKKVYKKTN